MTLKKFFLIICLVIFSATTAFAAAPLSPEQMQTILATPKGERPAPETYLSKKYVKNHLKKFKKGLSIITSLQSFEKYMLHADLIGREDNTCFVMPKKFCDEIEKEAGGYTVGDMPEAVVDRIPKIKIIVRFLPASKN